MSKFLPIGTKGELLNSDMIARIIPRKMADASSSPKMVSTSTVRSTFTTKSMTTTPFVPLSLARGVSAVYLDDDGDSEICPCAFVMLMSDGKIEPFVFATDKDIERIANKGHTGFTGFVPTK